MSPRRVWIRIGVAVCALLLAAPLRAQTDPPLVVDHVSVVDVRSGAVASDQRVVVAGDRIESVGASPAARAPAGATAVDGRGLFLIPGLWDMHVHLAFGDWFPRSGEIVLPLLVANGVTGVRDLGSELDVVQGWRRDIEAGRRTGPRIVTSGPMLDGPKPRFPSSIAVATPEDGRRAVIDLKRRGADFIKLQSLIPRDAVLAIAAEARAQHIPFEGHVPDAMRAAEMSELGMRSFEHLIGIFEASSPDEAELMKGGKTLTRLLAHYDPARTAKLASVLAAHRTWQCPTLVWERGGNLLDQTDFAADPRARYAPASWKNGSWRRFTDEIRAGYANDPLDTRKRFLETELQLVQQLHRAGVPFLAGTDTPAGVYIFPGFSLHEELARFVAAGFSPLEALQTATLNPARFLEREADLGSVEPGKRADLLLLAANPLADIANTQKIAGVIAAGRYLDRARLDALLSGAEAAAAN